MPSHYPSKSNPDRRKTNPYAPWKESGQQFPPCAAISCSSPARQNHGENDDGGGGVSSKTRGKHNIGCQGNHPSFAKNATLIFLLFSCIYTKQPFSLLCTQFFKQQRQLQFFRQLPCVSFKYLIIRPSMIANYSAAYRAFSCHRFLNHASESRAHHQL